ncbi:hypothetical protein, partial [Burkholderia ubonensis]|uniref:hypothetical protein n=1 Tax=Burkholderia ubonensis TaxID=101571 RepID=UPI001E2BE7D2
VFATSRASRAAVLVATHARSVCKQTRTSSHEYLTPPLHPFAQDFLHQPHKNGGIRKRTPGAAGNGRLGFVEATGNQP